MSSLTLMVLDSSILVLLVLGDHIVEVGLSLSELHLVHTFASVPVKESLSGEHRLELAGEARPDLLDGSGVAEESGGHLETGRRDVTNGSLDVVRDPLDEIGRVLVDHVEHLLIDLLGGDFAAEHAGAGEVSAVTRVGSAHHVLGVELLLSELGNGVRLVGLSRSRGERSEAHGEEVETWEGHKVDGKLAEVAVKLAREAEGAGGATGGSADEVVEVSVGRSGELEGLEADVVESLVVKNVSEVRVLNELVS